MKNLILLLILMTNGVIAQDTDDIEMNTVSISQGNVDGFVLLFPGATMDLVHEEWVGYSSLLGPPIQPGEGEPSIPFTREVDYTDNEFVTHGVFLPEISDHLLDIYTLIDSLKTDSSTDIVNPTIQLSVAIDLGYGHFLNSDETGAVEEMKEVLRSFALQIHEILMDPSKR
jgi:hypothetical protein